MAKSGLKHIDVGPELSKSEWESQESHELIHGTSFPSSPVERQLFYRDDQHKWYIYDGTEWVSLQGGGGMEVHGNEYHDPDFEQEGVAATLVEAHRVTETHSQDQPPAEHGNEKHDPDFATGVALTTHEAATSGVHGAGGNTLWHGGLANIINRTHLSQVFGTSSLRLCVWNFTPKTGKAFQVFNAATSPFDADIAADGGGGGNLSTTNVPFDGETNLNCLKNIQTGADRWGRFILHNTTRSNTRLIVDFDETNKAITTEASIDDWAENDVITLQSQTCTQAGYMDVDLSDEIAATEVAAYISLAVTDKSAGAQAGRRMILHPYESYNAGKRIVCPAALASEFTAFPTIMSIVSQRVCVYFDDWTDFSPSLSVLATLEYADT